MRKIILPVTLIIFILIRGNAQQQWDKPMEIKSCFIDIKATHFTATTFIELEFCNPNNKEIEGLYRFELRPEQVITAFQLDLAGKYRDGSIEEKWKATTAYNTIVGKRIDPALLTMESPGRYSLRIYPVPANGCRKITLSIQEFLRPGKNTLEYSLPLTFKNPVQHFKINITTSGSEVPVARTGPLAGRTFNSENGDQTLAWEVKDFSLATPVSFSLPVHPGTIFCSKTTGSEAFFALRFHPSIAKEYNLKPGTLSVFWDASASLSRRDIKKEISFLKQFISYHNVSQLTIIPFNHRLLDTAVFYTENDFKSRWQQYLQDISYDGATQLGIIDLTGLQSGMTLLFSDGNNTYGKSQPRTGNALVTCITTSALANRGALQEIVGAGGGKVIDLHRMNLSSAISSSSIGENWLMNISSSSGKIVTEQTLPLPIEPALFVNGTMKEGVDTLYFHYGNNYQVSHIEKLVIDSKKECGGSAIDRISILSNFERILRTYSWSELVDFGLREKVVTLNTAYIVLERVEDYVKYNIAPPKELEEACEKMNYVKKDTRFERNRIQELSEFDIVNKIVPIYNERIRKWGVNEKSVFLERSQFDKIDYPANTTLAINGIVPSGNAISGKVAGLGVTTNALEEVVVTGYGSMRRNSVTGAIAQVRSRDIFSSATSIQQALEGKVPGMQVVGSSGLPGASPVISIRGISSINGNNQPLFILDGTPVSGNINDLVNVQDINDITVLKDITASSLYGVRAAGGAIIINTKKGKNYYNHYNNKPYRLKDMEDMEYMQELKSAPNRQKMHTYDQMKEQYGGEAGFYFDVAQYFFQIGLRTEALGILMNAAEAANGNQQVLVAIGYILESWREFDQAINIYEQLVKDNPAEPGFYNDLAWAHYQSGNYQQAIDILYRVIKMNTGQNEYANLYKKSMLLNDMNAIISLHKDKLDISNIPSSLLRPMPVDMRLVIDCNKVNLSDISIKEPGGYTCNYANPITKNGGSIQQGYYWYGGNPFEYQVRKAPAGKYKISVNYYDHYGNDSKTPSVIRIRKFKNFGKENQTIEIENVMMDNQYGKVEIAEVKWELK